MSKGDIVQWVAIGVTLVISILVPLLTQIANNSHQVKMKKLEFEEEREKDKRAVYEHFLENVGGCIMFAEAVDMKKIGASIQRLYVYLPHDNWNQLMLLYDYIRQRQWDEAKEIMEELTAVIAKEMELQNNNSLWNDKTLRS